MICREEMEQDRREEEDRERAEDAEEAAVAAGDAWADPRSGREETVCVRVVDIRSRMPSGSPAHRSSVRSAARR